MVSYKKSIQLSAMKKEFDAARVNTTVGPKSEMYRMLSRIIDIFCKLRSGDINNFIYDQKLF